MMATSTTSQRTLCEPRPRSRGAGRIGFTLAIALAAAAWQLAAAQDRDTVVMQFEQRLTQLRAEARFREAEEVGQQMLAFATRNYGGGSLMQAAALSDLAAVNADWKRYPEAQQQALEAIRIVTGRQELTHPLLGDAYNNLASCYFYQHRYQDAAAMHQRALAARRASRSKDVDMSLENLALCYDMLGRYDQAEPLYQQAFRGHVSRFGGEHRAVAVNLTNQGLMYKRQHRLDEAEAYFREALRIFGAIEAPDKEATALTSLGDIYLRMGRFAEAERLYQQAHEKWSRVFGVDHPAVAMQVGLGELYFTQERYAEAEPIFARSLQASQEFYGPQSLAVAADLTRLGRLYMAQAKDEAEEIFDVAVNIFERQGASWAELGELYFLRGISAWQAGHKDKARADFAQAMRMADQGRAFITGAEHQKAQSFAELHQWYSVPGSLYAADGQLEEALATFERGRSRLLIEEMSLAHVDLTDGLSPAEQQRLQLPLQTAQRELAECESQLELLPERDDLGDQAREQQTRELIQEIADKRAAVVAADTAIRAASPRLRELLGRDFQPVALAEIEAWAKDNEALVLYYSVNEYGSQVLVIGGGRSPQATEIVLSASQAELLGVSAGKLSEAKLTRALAGILEHLSKPGLDEITANRLAALWQILVPDWARQALQEKAIKHLVVIPDQALALLPFESLVIENEERRRYLIDAEVAVDYAPSATILLQLARRPTAPARADREPVLAVGDPSYDSALEQSAAAARYAGVGGQLQRLPYSGQEATWVTEVFRKEGVKSAILKGKLATEWMVRGNVSGRRIVHLACHGLVDQSYGNFFGALALAPDPTQQARPENNGFLSLAETYSLDLKDCELTILSACQTNYGPQKRGEGTFALTRGFLVAGSRRVVASNWLVDDEAAASLVSYFCSLVAKREHAGEKPDYARALADAKRWIRTQPKWQDPYFWATFELVGPQ